MKPNKAADLFWLKIVFATLASLLLISVLISLVYPVYQISTVRNGNEQNNVSLPWEFPEPSKNNKLILDIQVGAWTPRVWHITPDDHLKSINVNGKDVDLTSIGDGVKDYGKGFNFDFSDQLIGNTNNRLIFLFDNNGGPGGINIKPVLSPFFWLLVLLSFSPFIISLSLKFRLLPEQKILIFASLVAIAFYWADTPWTNRTYDVQGGSGHYDYIVYIATRLALPSPLDGWTFYHPPIYYLGGAAFWHWADWLNLPKPEFIRVYGLFLWFIFVVSSLGLINYFLKNRYHAIYASSAALLFWPGAVMHSVSIGNDIALYAFSGLSLWFLVRWWNESKRSDLVYMGLCCALAFLSKSSAFALIGACGLLVLWRFFENFKHQFKIRFFDLIIFSFISGAGLVLSFVVRIYYYLNGSIPHWLIANSGGLNGALKVSYDVPAFIPLDIPKFISSPWMSAWDDATGRNNFWNYLLRSSFTGEFQFDGVVQTSIAVIWGVLLLLLIFLLIKFALDAQFKKAIHAWPLLLTAGFWILSLIILRIEMPYSCSNDFRYVLPVLVPFVIACALAGGFARQILWGMAITSSLFFLTL